MRPRSAWSHHPLVVDVAVVLVVGVPTALDAWWNTAGSRRADALTYVLLAVSIGALVWRRRWPVAVALVCGLALTGWYALGHHGEALNLPTIVALYTVAVQGDRRRTVVAGVVAVVWAGSVAWLAEDRQSAPAAEMAWPVIALLLGEVVRGRRELMAEYASRAVRAEEDREREAQRRVEEERLRIAREFHDVVAHTMAAVNVQMNVAVAAFDTRPEAARQALTQARASSREALQELRATVALLREGTDGSPVATRDGAIVPVPGLAGIDDLVEQAGHAGLAVTLRRDVEGDVPAGVGLAAYRIVQEALANVVRHAGASRVAVRLGVEPGVLAVEVRDDGCGAVPPGSVESGGPGEAHSPGHGLLGMSERAAALGGTLTHGASPGGGYVVQARLPLAEVAR